MASRKDTTPSISRLLYSLRGSSYPVLARADNGCMYVVKSPSNPHGSSVLFNECAGSILYRELGMQTARWTPVLAPTCFFSSQEKVSEYTPGVEQELCFASHYLGEQYRILEILSGSLLAQVQNRESFWLAWVVDVCAKHTDNRQAIFVKMPVGYKAVFIDHGDMFGGPNGVSVPRYVVSQYLDDRIYGLLTESKRRHIQDTLGNLDLSTVWKKVLSMPAIWKNAQALSQFDQTLNQLSNSAFICKILDAIMDIHEGNHAQTEIKKPVQNVMPYSKLWQGRASA